MPKDITRPGAQVGLRTTRTYRTPQPSD